MFLRALTIVLLGTVVLSCLLTPAVYSLILAVYPNFSSPYSRVFNRVIMLVAVLLILWKRKDFRLEGLAGQMRAVRTAPQLKLLGMGIVLSLATSMAMLPVVIAGTQLEWAEHSVDYYFVRFPGVLATAIVVSLLEEFFFRGLVFQSIRNRYSFLPAALGSSAFYAVLHFITPIKSYAYPGYSFFLGFDYFVKLFERLAMPGLLGGVVGLFLVGMTLCIALQRTGSLALCIGLHAGWVIAMKYSMYCTITGPEVQFLPATGRRYFLATQPIVWSSIALVAALVMVFAERARRMTASKDPA